ncbi:hypothetical protein RBG61_12015 [Paludicola sp. MB14-C6]|uniref:hypothetical protein n=1 Tax=Paludihabitans sp. MB14-C6 TaxID=3070656 RepID=UPI0027DE463C|nr:hypothetical protein [Paludicola sp. MB14-C6]WMJ22709.1 hypothetical protein RBG61_12015 [Paludicola sp. MB14-C6]
MAANKEENKNSKVKKTAVAIIILLLLLLSFVFLIKLKEGSDMSNPNTIPVEKPVIEEGEIERKSVEEIKQELQKIVDKSMINTRLNARPYCDEQGYYNLLIESTNRNILNYVLEYQRVDTGETIWKSPMIEPNQNIKKAKIFTTLPKGETKCRVIYHGFRREDNQYIGFTSWQIKMYS